MLAIIGDTILVPNPSLSFWRSCAAAPDVIEIQMAKPAISVGMDRFIFAPSVLFSHEMLLLELDDQNTTRCWMKRIDAISK